jgi:hypothetical protein
MIGHLSIPAFSLRKVSSYLLAFSLLWICALNLRAQVTIPSESALKLAPESAAYFMSISNLETQWNRLANSRAFDKLMSMIAGGDDLKKDEFMKSFFEGFMSSFDDSEEFRQWIAMPENQELVAVVSEVWRSEMFTFASEDSAELTKAYLEIYSEFFSDAAINGFDDPANEEQIMKKILAKMENQKMADIVIGFRLRNREQARRQLDRLPAFLNEVLIGFDPRMVDRVKWEKLGRGDYVTFYGTGEDIPWDEIEANEIDEQEKESFELAKSAIKDKSIGIAVGLFDDYLLISFGDNLDHLKTLGEGKSLYDHPKLELVRQTNSEPSVMTTYVSQRYSEIMYDFERMVSLYGDISKSMLRSEDFQREMNIESEELERKITSDIDEMARDISQYIQKPGASLTHITMSENGYEGFSQSWVESKFIDGSKKLDIINHLGESPMCAFAYRGKHRPQDFKLMMKWTRKGLGYVEHAVKEGEFELETDDPVHVPFDEIYALLDRFDTTIDKNWIPNRIDEQFAFVVDDALKTRQPFPGAPRATTPLRIPEFALIYSINDSKKIEQLGTDILGILNDGIRLAEDASGESFAGFKIPQAELENEDGMKFYFYPVGAMITGTGDFEPTAGLSDSWLAFAFSQKHAKQLLSENKSTLGPFLARFADSELAAICHVDFVEISNMAEGWIIYGLEAMNDDSFDGNDFEVSAGSKQDEAAAYVRGIMDYVRCIKSYSSATYSDGKSVISEFEFTFQDIK